MNNKEELLRDKNNFFEDAANDINNYFRKHYLLNFFVWFTILGVIWSFFILVCIFLMWNPDIKIEFEKNNEGDFDGVIWLNSFWRISSIDNSSDTIYYKPQPNWGFIFLPILGTLITIGSSIIVILISNHRQYKYKIFYKNFLDNFQISNKSIDINKPIYKTNIFYLHIFLIVLYIVSLIVILSLYLEKPNLDFAFHGEEPGDVYKYLEFNIIKRIEIEGEKWTIFIKASPSPVIIVFLIIYLVSSILIFVINFVYKKHINDGIIEGIDEIIDQYYVDENLNESLI